MQSIHSSFHTDSDSVLSNGINGVTFTDENPNQDIMNSTNRSSSNSSKEKRAVKTASGGAVRDTPRTGHRSETGSGWRGSGQPAVSEHRSLARGRNPKTSQYSTIVANKPLSFPEKRSVDKANPPRNEDDRRKYTESLSSESHDAGSSSTPSKMDMFDQHTPRKFTSVSSRNTNIQKQNVEDSKNSPSRKKSSQKIAKLQTESSFEKNSVLPEIGNGGKHEVDSIQLTKDSSITHISSHGKQTIGLTDEMPHTSFMEASRRNIASSLSSMSAARRRLDRSTSIELLRPITVPNFTTVRPSPVHPQDNNLNIIKSTSGATNDVILFRKRSQSVPDIVSPRAAGANRPPRAAWKPARNSQLKSNNSRSAEKTFNRAATLKKDGPSWSMNNSSGEFPLLTGKNELVLFEPGVVFFDDSISSNIYYDSLFKTVRRSMCDIYKHKNNHVNGK